MIIDVAAGLFATVGLRRTTMESIAAAAGRGRRTATCISGIRLKFMMPWLRWKSGRLRIAQFHSTFRGAIGCYPQRYGEERARRLVDLIRRNPLLIRDFARGTAGWNG
jgi:hypothetical protein